MTQIASWESTNLRSLYEAYGVIEIESKIQVLQKLRSVVIMPGIAY